MREAMEAYGYNPETTPVDTLMAGPVQMHLDVAEAMEFPDKDDINTWEK